MSLESILILTHVATATIGLLSGALAMLFRKGSGLHGAAGTAFFVSMLIMSSSGAWIATFARPNRGNVLVSILTFYLVATAWVAARRRETKTGAFDRIALVVVLMDGLAGVTWGFMAAGRPRGMMDKLPAAIYFVFGSIALLCAFGDLRMIRRGGYSGAKRIARHLWRMCFALLIATFSFFPGQARNLPDAMRKSTLPYIPHVLLIGMMIFWLVRVRRKARPRVTGGGPATFLPPSEASAILSPR